MADNQPDQKPNKPYHRFIYIGAGAASGVAVTVLAAALLLPAAVEARRGAGDDPLAGPGKHLMKMFRAADTNDDRRLSVSEFKTATGERFTAADADGDGEVTQDETLEYIIERMKERIDEAFQRADQDENGTVSEAEYAERMLQRFGRMDRNDDGFLSREDRRGPGGRGGHDRDRHDREDKDQDTEPGSVE